LQPTSNRSTNIFLAGDGNAIGNLYSFAYPFADGWPFFRNKPGFWTLVVESDKMPDIFAKKSMASWVLIGRERY